MKNALAKTLLAGLAGGLTLNCVMVLTFRFIGFGWHGGGILLNPSFQSRKLIAVWTQMEPLPLVVSHPMQIFLGLVLFGMRMETGNKRQIGIVKYYHREGKKAGD